MNTATENKQMPVLLLTGYLGSGKTTLVNHILSNKRGIKFAVIVNDLGEVNIDADLIQKGGVVGQSDDSLVALQNGCICCTLKMDLIEQITELCAANRFDYIVIEASGICEPVPIAQTICSAASMMPPYVSRLPRLDCIVSVVDACRMKSEFSCGEALTKENIEEENIENLVIEQVEFCNIILLNKASMLKAEELGRLRAIIHTLNPGAEIIACDYTEVDLDKMIHTQLFDFEKVATSAAWINEMESIHDDDDKDGHEHHHEHEHNCHHHDEGEAEEYGIGTYVYYRRTPLDSNKFDYAVIHQWPSNIIRAKGLCYFKDDIDKCWLFEQAGLQKEAKDAGRWFATLPQEQVEEMMQKDAGLRRDWDPEYGDRMIKIVFIGRNLDHDAIDRFMDACM